MNFKDYFSSQAQAYAAYRPQYPPELFAYLASLSRDRHAAWDCATGNGQVALGLLPYFETIYATDASANQIAHAFQHPQITYAIAPAEQVPLADGLVELVTVGMALHWFNLDLFYREVRRVVKPGGAIAAWCYGEFELPDISETLHSLIQAFKVLVEPYWAPEVSAIRDQYQTLPFPFQEVNAPSFVIRTRWTEHDLIGYLTTWSATQQLMADQGEELVSSFTQQIMEAWQGHDIEVRWQIWMRVGTLS
ncbi:MAG: class I SAM-dependent methyltransferase [Synechococcales bacterium]|nr:class I SAM-dependent methyltransferase [Synechococcales bacterium]